jgi:ketosteroid isomerase-like protein
MTRIVQAGIALVLAGLGFGSLALGAPHRKVGAGDARAADLAGIEKLHKADVAATLTQDPGALTELWSDDGVNLQFPGGPVMGIKPMGEAYAKFRKDYPEFKVLKYAPVITEVQIVDGSWAIEVGKFEATFRTSAKDQPVSVSDKGVRVLKKQSDGSWKFAVVGLK